jgi:hypothetical protein
VPAVMLSCTVPSLHVCTDTQQSITQDKRVCAHLSTSARAHAHTHPPPPTHTYCSSGEVTELPLALYWMPHNGIPHITFSFTTRSFDTADHNGIATELDIWTGAREFDETCADDWPWMDDCASEACCALRRLT